METITKIYRSFKDKEGNKLVTKDGREYERVSIKTNEHGDKWISGFGSFGNKNWKEGDTVDIEVEQKGKYWNFKMPNKVDNLFKLYKALEQRVSALEGNDESEKHEELSEEPSVPDNSDDISVSEIPF